MYEVIQNILKTSLKDMGRIPSLTENLLNEVDVEINEQEMSVGQNKAHEYRTLRSASQLRCYCLFILKTHASLILMIAFLKITF